MPFWRRRRATPFSSAHCSRSATTYAHSSHVWSTQRRRTRSGCCSRQPKARTSSPPDWISPKADNVVIDELHYDTEFVLYRTLEKTKGIQLRIARHRNGVIDASDIEPLVDKRTRLVSVAWVSHQNGFCHDMRPIADVAHAKGALFYTDAIQAVGSFPIDVQAAGVDFLCAGTYKWLLASFGVAPFYVRAGVADRLRLDRFGEMHARELPDHTFEIETKAKRFDYSSRAFGDVYTLSAGLAYLEKVGVARIGAHTSDGLALRLQNGLANQGHRLFTPMGNRSSIVTFYSTKGANSGARGIRCGEDRSHGAEWHGTHLAGAVQHQRRHRQVSARHARAGVAVLFFFPAR